jgi:Mrp family chromosome partitioning ATPase
MSRNFEFLHETGQEGALFSHVPPNVSARQNASRVFCSGSLAFHDEAVKLVQRIFLLSGTGAFRVVVFCGVEQGDGAGSICALAGKILAAQVSKPVCIVDADLRGGKLHEHFGVPNEKGLQDALLQSDPVQNYARKLAISNLSLVPCGSGSQGRISLPPDRLRHRLRALRTEFEYILVHAPAASVSDDAVLLGELADGVVLVVRANVTHRETARKAVESLRSANVTLLGAVVKNRTFPVPEALYRRL